MQNLLALLSLLLLYAAIKRSCKYGLLLSPFSIVVLIACITVYLPSLVLTESITSNSRNLQIIILISLFTFYFSIDDSRWLHYRLIKPKRQQLASPVVLAFALIYAMYLLGKLLSLYILSGGLWVMMTRDRVDEYLHEGITSGTFEQFFLLLPSLAYLIVAGKLMNSGKYMLSVAMMLFLTIYYFFTANTRLPILMPIAALGVYAVFIRNGKLVKRFGPFLVFASPFVVSIFGFFANLLRHGIAQIDGPVLALMHQQNLNQLKYPIWLNDLASQIDSGLIPMNFGLSWLYMPFINIIPRMLWPSKPLTSTSNILSEKVYGITVGDGSPITTFTIWGEAYWQFGLIGVFLAVFVFYLLYRVIAYSFTSYKDTELVTIYILIQWIPFVRAEMPVFFVLTNCVGLFILAMLSGFFRTLRPLVKN